MPWQMLSASAWQHTRCPDRPEIARMGHEAIMLISCGNTVACSNDSACSVGMDTIRIGNPLKKTNNTNLRGKAVLVKMLDLIF